MEAHKLIFIEANKVVTIEDANTPYAFIYLRISKVMVPLGDNHIGREHTIAYPVLISENGKINNGDRFITCYGAIDIADESTDWDTIINDCPYKVIMAPHEIRKRDIQKIQDEEYKYGDKFFVKDDGCLILQTDLVNYMEGLKAQ